WYRVNQNGGTRSAMPPKDVIQDVLATPNMPLPILRGIVHVPVFSPSGCLRTEPGYDEESGLYHAPPSGLFIPDIPANPTSHDIAVARQLLYELLLDFPFVSDADRTNAIAVLLLPFVRNLIDGPTPLHLIEKPTPGTGASLLAD